MRFLSFLAHASSLCNISSMFLRGTGKYLPVTRNKMLSVRADESDENMGQFYKLVPVSQEEASKSTDKNIISYEYIKKLENENENLTERLKAKSKVIKNLNCDLKRMESERLLCMIYESYQRFRKQISDDLEECGDLEKGSKFDVFLDSVKKGKIIFDESVVHWMIHLDNTKGMQLLRDFRNAYSHYTNDDLSILRQWRTKIIEECENESIINTPNEMMFEAALTILNTLIDNASRPTKSRLLKRKRKKPELNDSGNSKALKISEFAPVSPKTSKKQLKDWMKLVKKNGHDSRDSSSVVPSLAHSSESFSSDQSDETSFGNDLPIERTEIYKAYHRNSILIGKLRKNGEMTALKYDQICRLRAENQQMIKEFGSEIMCKTIKKAKKYKK